MAREGIRRALLRAGVPLIRINPRVFAVQESDLVAFIAKRGESPGRGRPQGAKNKAKEKDWIVRQD